MLVKSSFCRLSPWRLGTIVFLWAALSPAATWSGGRTTPALTEIAAVDATGEVDATGQPDWIYGFEDLAGDGYTFKEPEQSIDVRTAYAATDPQRFWARIYVSDTQTPGGNVSGYVFIDADQNTATGGTAIAPEINAQFTTDVSPGGYEYVLELPGSGTTTQVWQYQAGGYVASPVVAARGVAESGVDLDPIRINADRHGYLQASVDLSVVGLTEACTANLYFRSVNKQAAIGKSDLEVGQVTSCIPTTNSSGVPTVLVPPSGCTSSTQCAAGGICQAGQCVFAVPCVTNADCGANMTCTADGRCVPTTGGACTTNTDCSTGLVCSNGQCTACSLGGTQCGTGQICGPNGLCIPDQGVTGTCTTTATCATGLVCSNGQCVACTSNAQCGSGLICQASRCVSGTGAGGSGGGGQLVLQPGDKVEGGACNCTMPGGSRSTAPTGMLLVLPLLASLRRRARRSARRPH